MAKSFYSSVEAAQRLGKTEADLKVLVRDGKLREFRDGATVNYKIDDVEKLAGSAPAPGPAKPAPAAPAPSASAGKDDSGAGEIVLEPADDSSVELSTGLGSDILTLEEADADETSAGGRMAAKSKDAKSQAKKEGSAVASVGVSVFDEDDLDEHVDPLAQTAVTDIAGMGLEGAGAGSGIMDLTRESDDTSLGRELLEEIYTPETAPDAAAEDTAAGTEAVEEEADLEEAEPEPASDKKVVKKRGRTAVATAARESALAADPATVAMTALLGIGVLVMVFASLAAASLVRGVVPAMFQWVYANMLIAVPVAFVVAGVAGGLSFYLSRRSR